MSGEDGTAARRDSDRSFIKIGSFEITWRIAARFSGGVGVVAGALLSQVLHGGAGAAVGPQGDLKPTAASGSQCVDPSQRNTGSIPTILPSPRGAAPVEKITPGTSSSPANQPVSAQAAPTSAPASATPSPSIAPIMSAGFDLANGAYIDVRGEGFPPDTDLRILVNGTELGTRRTAQDGTLDSALLVQQSLLSSLVGGTTYIVTADLGGSALANAQATAPGVVGQVLGGFLGILSSSTTQETTDH